MCAPSTYDATSDDGDDGSGGGDDDIDKMGDDPADALVSLWPPPPPRRRPRFRLGRGSDGGCGRCCFPAGVDNASASADVGSVRTGADACKNLQ